MMRMISRAAASLALVAAMGSFCAAQDYAPAPSPKPAPKSPGQTVFSDAQLQKGAGQPANGLQLTLTADRLVLAERPAGLGAPLIVEPTVLHLLFTNVSGSPLVMDAYNLTLNRLNLIVVGPEKETVAVTRKPLNVRTRVSLPIDYPQIEPGNKFVTMEKLQFPGDFNLLSSCALYLPGEYKAQVIYTRPAEGAPSGIWQGTVVSNTLTFRVQGLMPPMPPLEKTTPETPSEPAPPPPTPPKSHPPAAPSGLPS